MWWMDASYWFPFAWSNKPQKASERFWGRDNQTNMNRRREMTSAVKFSDLSGGWVGWGFFFSLRPTERMPPIQRNLIALMTKKQREKERERERSWWIGWRRKCEACQPILLPLLPSDFTQQPRNYYGAISYMKILTFAF
jgi:hypothetical protein